MKPFFLNIYIYIKITYIIFNRWVFKNFPCLYKPWDHHNHLSYYIYLYTRLRIYVSSSIFSLALTKIEDLYISHIINSKHLPARIVCTNIFYYNLCKDNNRKRTYTSSSIFSPILTIYIIVNILITLILLSILKEYESKFKSKWLVEMDWHIIQLWTCASMC
jgi:hypothetical protein